MNDFLEAQRIKCGWLRFLPDTSLFHILHTLDQAHEDISFLQKNVSSMLQVCMLGYFDCVTLRDSTLSSSDNVKQELTDQEKAPKNVAPIHAETETDDSIGRGIDYAITSIEVFDYDEGLVLPIPVDIHVQIEHWICELDTQIRNAMKLRLQEAFHHAPPELLAYDSTLRGSLGRKNMNSLRDSNYLQLTKDIIYTQIENKESEEYESNTEPRSKERISNVRKFTLEHSRYFLWINDLLLQVSLTALGVFWTALAESIILQMSQRTEFATNTNNDKIQEETNSIKLQFSALATNTQSMSWSDLEEITNAQLEMVCSEMQDRSARNTKKRLLKLSAIVLQLQILQDCTKRLIASQASNTSDWAWQRELKWDIDEVSDKISLNLLGMGMEYGYFYLGTRPRVIVTPTADKAMVSLRRIIVSRSCAFIHGDLGTGRSGIIDDFSVCAGIPVAHIQCSSTKSIESIELFTLGAAQVRRNEIN